MPEVQEIIEWLGCLTAHQHKCGGCPFNPHPGREWVYGCIKGQADIVTAARDALRRYQEEKNNGQGDCLHEHYERVKAERDKVLSEKQSLVDGIKRALSRMD